jgi:hypothetical protein
MPRSSETVAAIATALAKAQAALINPEKSLVATIRTDGLAKLSGPFGMRHWRVVSILCARR